MGVHELRRRQGRPPPPTLAALREAMGDIAHRYPLEEGVSADHILSGGVRCLELRPGPPRGSVLYFHGGGFRMGSPQVSAGFASRIAALTGCRMVMPYYGLAPENPFPGALLDGEGVLAALAEDGPLFVAGDSAGGNLAAVLANRHPDRVAGLILLSPWLDLRLGAASYGFNGESDVLFSRRAAVDAAELYLQGHSATDPMVSPLLADLSLMPPVLLAAGSVEVLLDDALAFAAGLAGAARPVSLHLLAGMGHVEPVLDPASDNTAAVTRLVASFILARMAV